MVSPGPAAFHVSNPRRILMCATRLILQKLVCLSWVSLVVLGCNRESKIERSDLPYSGLKSFTNDDSNGIPNWPNLYGPDYSSFSREQGLQTCWDAQGPVKLWSRTLGSGYSSPIVIAGKLIVAFRRHDQEIIECLNAATGELIWQHTYPTTFQCEFEYSNGPYSSPVANDRSVFFVGGQGQFKCLDLQTGALNWERDILAEYGVALKEWPVTCSPLLLEDRLVFNVGGGQRGAGIVALDIHDGTTLWKATNHGFSHATPTVASIHGRQYVFVVTQQGLVSLDPTHGSVHWQLPHQTRRAGCYNAVSPVVWKDWVCFVTGPNTGIRCLKIQPDGQFSEPWTNRRLLDSQYTNLLLVDGFLYGFMSTGQGGPDYRCIDIQTGRLMWKAKMKIGRGTQLAVEQSILIWGEKGTLATVDLNPRRFKEIYRSPKPLLCPPCYTAPCLANAKLFLRNEEQLICFALCPETALSE